MRNRLLSVDVFRGMTIMLMTVVNNPGTWEHIYPPLRHAEWHGVTPTDWVFPFFLFIMGVAVPLSAPQKTWTIDSMGKILTRTFRIFSLGLFLSFFSKIQFFGLEGPALLAVRMVFVILTFALLLGKYDKKLQFYVSLIYLSVLIILAYGGFEAFANVRIPGVLQRIALVYFAVSLIYFHTSGKVQVIIAAVVLFGYWAAMALIDVGYGQGNLEAGKNLAAWVDSKLLAGHMWSVTKTWDPEGILSTIPAIVTGLLGMMVGKILIAKIEPRRKLVWFITVGLVLLAGGLFWNHFFPMNKALWTSSFVLYTAGVGLLILGVLYLILDLVNLRKWALPFQIFGVNPMLVFFASGIIPRALGMIQWQGQSLQSHLYNDVIAPLFTDPKAASLAGALIYLVIWFLILTLFYRRKMIFKV